MVKLLRRLKRDCRGNVLAISAAGIFAMVGGAGLGTDTIQWFLWQRQLQQASDAGALAGAHTLLQNGDYTAAAKSELNRNANTTVLVERIVSPPQSGAYAGDPKAVEVVATTSRSLPFSSLFLAHAPVMRARAVATGVKGGNHCVIALAQTGVGVEVGGSANVQLGCGVAANSVASNAIYLHGSSVTKASPLSAVGGITAASSNIAAGTDLQSYGVAKTDPMAARQLEVPAQPSTCTATRFEAPPNQAVSIAPGRYCDGMTLKGDVTMSPGVYIVDRGSFNVESQARVTGDGVTIVLTGSSATDVAVVDIAGGAAVDLKAPTAVQDPYWKSVLFFQDPMAADRLSSVAGGSSLKLQGIVYMPGGKIEFAGSSGQQANCLFLVGKRVTLTGATGMQNSCPADYDDDFSALRVRVVE